MKYLPPIFEIMPPELIQKPRWVCWRGAKLPCCPTAVNSMASVKDQVTWGTFNQAQAAYEEGGYEGVGFVLNGDGIVGIDIDNCGNDGEAFDAALQFMIDIGCQYVERSPSGNGLRGFGYAHSAPKTGRRGTFNGLNVELYSRGRYLTVTGHILTAEPLAELAGYNSVYDQLHSDCPPTEDTEVTEEIECNTSISPTGTIRLPSKLMPTGPGQRNHKAFLLARHLKLMAPNASKAVLKPIVQEWHRMALPVIRTKDWDTTWLDFVTSWDTVKYFSETLTKVLSKLPELPPDCPASEFGQKALKLFQICVGLQQHEGDKPFFLSCTVAGDLVGIDRSDAAKLLTRFCKLDLLQLVTKGANGHASRYRVLRMT